MWKAKLLLFLKTHAHRMTPEQQFKYAVLCMYRQALKDTQNADHGIR